MKKTLLEKAKEHKSFREVDKSLDEELLEIAIAYVNGEIHSGHLASVGIPYSRIYILLVELRKGVREQKIKLLESYRD